MLRYVVVLFFAVMLISVGCRKTTTTASPQQSATQQSMQRPIQSMTQPTMQQPMMQQPMTQRTPQMDIVYITQTGKRYHRAGCRHLQRSSIPISRSDAIARGYSPCEVCRP